MDETPYQQGYTHGRSSELFQPGLFKTKLNKTAYTHGFNAGKNDREKENN